MVEWGVWWVLAIVVFLAKVLMLVELIVFDMVLTFARSVIGYLLIFCTSMDLGPLQVFDLGL